MPLDKLVLILVSVMIAAGVTVWLGVLIASASAWAWSGAVWLILVPVGLVAWVIGRVITDRLSNREDDHYDRIEK